MLTGLAIRDIVLIEALELDFRPGLNVLTGETGAGKSILMDALGFALGARSRRELLRTGADRGSVTAVFEPGPEHPVRAAAADLGIAVGDELILRRTLDAEGRARGFVDDQRVGAETLAGLGAALVEVHGQRDDRGLLDARGHRALLDAFGGLAGQVAGVGALWQARRAAERARDEARDGAAAAARDADWLAHAVAELRQFAPEPGEDATLDAARRLAREADRIREEVVRARNCLSGPGAEALALEALQRLERVADAAEGRLDDAIAALDRALAELGEAERAVAEAQEALTLDPGELERVEERLFALRALARKHRVAPDDLADVAGRLAARLGAIEGGAARVAALERSAARAATDHAAACEALTAARHEAAARLDGAVTAEMAPLRMERAVFTTLIEPAGPGPDGADRVRFVAAINPGTAPGPIDRIASGGELMRFLLALKVSLAAQAEPRTMVFDEIDRGIGGATADAVGRRLGRLAGGGQVLVVTHSPQVAALGAHHLRIVKELAGEATRTRVAPVTGVARVDEIARMLAGETITDEARSAAQVLIGAGR